MKLSQLLSVFPQLKWGDTASSDVTDVTQDSRQIKNGSVFVAIRGNAGDGHEFLAQAAKQGAIALIVEDDKNVPTEYRGAVVKVNSTRLALDQIARKYFGDPAANLFCVGVTGTNGKTTITYMVEKILNHFGWATGVLGTIDHHLGEHKWPSQLTTPDPLTLHRRLNEFVILGARAAAFEVSSHALDQSRADSLLFKVGIFTNFTRDHLDYHQSMEKYFAAKERLFYELLSPGSFAILNGDDPQIRKLRVREGVTTWWYGSKDADYLFRILKHDLNGSLFHLSTPRGNAEIHLPTTGIHNVYNATAAIAASLAAGVSLSTAAEAMSTFYGAPGRLEKIKNNKHLHIFVDYAHTDDALRSSLRSLHQLRTQGQRVLTVFGCGGDRDAGKRPLMAQAAAEFSDVIVITSDNPRTENPAAIIAQIRSGIPESWSGDLKIEADRRQALAIALQTAREGDVILIAGKGHEDYQIVGREKFPFSDAAVVGELLKAKAK